MPEETSETECDRLDRLSITVPVEAEVTLPKHSPIRAVWGSGSGSGSVWGSGSVLGWGSDSDPGSGSGSDYPFRRW